MGEAAFDKTTQELLARVRKEPLGVRIKPCKKSSRQDVMLFAERGPPPRQFLLTREHTQHNSLLTSLVSALLAPLPDTISTMFQDLIRAILTPFHTTLRERALSSRCEDH